MKCLISLIIAFIVYFPAISEAVSYDCGSLSTMIIQHKSVLTDSVAINGNGVTDMSRFIHSFQCSGIVDVTCSVPANCAISLIPFSAPYGVLDFSKIVSFLIGSLTAIAFVVAVDTSFGGGKV